MMISGIASHGFQQQLYSTPANNLGPQNSINSQDGESEASQQSPIPNDSQKGYLTVNPTVSSQEGQANQKESQRKEGENQTQAASKKAKSPTQLDEQELQQVQELKQRDIEVRAHEAAHLAAAGQYAQGGAKFSLSRGPDGRSYAIGGSVSIDTSPEATPEATIRKADQIKRAALAPAEPSGQDRSVAASAAKLKIDAQAKLAEELRKKPEQTEESSEKASATTTGANNETKSEESTSALESQVKTESQPTCAVCGGGHPTGPHLQTNQRKTDQYLAPIQGQEPQLNRVA